MPRAIVPQTSSSVSASRPKKRKWDWKPRRDGDLYCSPSCGCKCTFAAYELAVKRGAVLARKLGTGWTYEVWENGGWHYKAVLSQEVAMRVEVHADHYGSDPARYTAFVHNLFVASDANPRKALKLALKKAWDEHQAFEEMLLAVKDATASPAKLGRSRALPASEVPNV